MERLPYERLKTFEDLRKERVVDTVKEDNTGLTANDGEGSFGKVYIRNIRFKDGTKKKVAIKVYKKDFIESYKKIIRENREITYDEFCKKANDAISILYNSGISMPKIAYSKLDINDEEHVISVSNSFTLGNRKVIPLRIENSEQAHYLAREISKVLNLWFYVHIDMFHTFVDSADSTFNGYKLIDFDHIIAQTLMSPQRREYSYKSMFIRLILILNTHKSINKNPEILTHFIKEIAKNLDSDKIEVLINGLKEEAKKHHVLESTYSSSGINEAFRSFYSSYIESIEVILRDELETRKWFYDT